MMQKPWFKLFIWTVTVSFFFMAAGIIISVFSPGPSEDQVMKFTAGMMDAMSNSTMGLSMAIEENDELTQIIGAASDLTIPIIMIAVFSGIYIRIQRGKNSAG